MTIDSYSDLFQLKWLLYEYFYSIRIGASMKNITCFSVPAHEASIAIFNHMTFGFIKLECNSFLLSINKTFIPEIISNLKIIQIY